MGLQPLHRKTRSRLCALQFPKVPVGGRRMRSKDDGQSHRARARDTMAASGFWTLQREAMRARGMMRMAPF